MTGYEEASPSKDTGVTMFQTARFHLHCKKNSEEIKQDFHTVDLSKQSDKTNYTELRIKGQDE